MPSPSRGEFAEAILRDMMDGADLLGATPHGGVYVLATLPANLLQELEMFGADTIDDEEGDPPEDDDPGGGDVEDHGEPDADDEPDAETEAIDSLLRAWGGSASAEDAPYLANGFVRAAASATRNSNKEVRPC